MGTVFGEIGVLRGQPRSASVRTNSEARVLRIPGNAFRDLTENHPVISELVLETMFGRFRADQARDKARTMRRGATDCRIVPFFSATGGAGTSLTLANVAAYLRELTGSRVLTVDLDLMFGDLGPIFGVDAGPTISELLMEPSLTPEMIAEVTHAVAHQVDVIPGPIMPEDAEFVEPGFLERFFDVASQRYDWILVDTTGDVRDMTLELLDRAPLSVYVVTPEVTSMRNARRWFDLIERVGIDVNRIKVVPNKVGQDDATSLDFLRKHFDDMLLPELPEDVESAKRAVNTGELLRDAAPDVALSQALRRVAGALAGLELGEAPTSKMPFWKRWL